MLYEGVLFNGFVFVVMVKSINGVVCDDIIENGLKLILYKFNELGLMYKKVI